MLTNGLLGAIAIRSADVERVEHAGRGARLAGALEADAVDLVLVPAADEPLLERELSGGRGDPRPQAVVGRGQQDRFDPERASQASGHGGQRLAAAQRLGPREVQPEVAVAELEPRLGPGLGRRVARVPGLLRAAPALGLVENARERVEDRVQVGRDVEARDLEIVAHVPDDRDVTRVERLRQRAREAGASEPACEQRDLHRVSPARSSSRTAAVRGPSRSSSRSRSATVSTSSTRFGISAVTESASSRAARAWNRSALPGP